MYERPRPVANGDQLSSLGNPGQRSAKCQFRKRPTTLNYVLPVDCSLVAPPALGATTRSHVAYGRASRIILKGVSAARRTLEKPPLWMTSRSFFSPA